MRILKARYRSGADFLLAHQPAFLFGGIFFPTRETIALGEAVIVEVRFPELADRLLLRGFVAWRRAARLREGLRAGIGVEFLSAERHKHDFLVAVAQGRAGGSVVARNHRRLPISFKIDWRVKEERDRYTATVDDIGPGGAFIRTRELHPAGTPLVIELTPPGSAAPLSIEARVAWARQSPGEEGLGVEFRCRDTGGLRRLKELIRRLALLDASAA
jgi:Tfp pilus assembly protein PilZ